MDRFSILLGKSPDPEKVKQIRDRDAIIKQVKESVSASLSGYIGGWTGIGGYSGIVGPNGDSSGSILWSGSNSSLVGISTSPQVMPANLGLLGNDFDRQTPVQPPMTVRGDAAFLENVSTGPPSQTPTLLVEGGDATFSGSVAGIDPQDPAHLATKKYVDKAIEEVIFKVIESVMDSFFKKEKRKILGWINKVKNRIFGYLKLSPKADRSLQRIGLGLFIGCAGVILGLMFLILFTR